MIFTPSTDEPGSPLAIAARLLRLPEFQHLVDGEAAIDWMLRTGPQVIEGQRLILGRVHIPSVQGKLNSLFEFLLEEKLGRVPDFLIILDGQYWADADARDREVLVYHEMCHCIHAVDQYGSQRFTRDGAPIWALRGHDIEEFDAVVRRYGLHSEELRRFVDASGEHDIERITHKPGVQRPEDRPLN